MPCFRCWKLVKDLGLSISPLAFCLFGSLIRRTSLIGGTMSKILAHILTDQRPVENRDGFYLSKVPVNVPRLYFRLCLGDLSTLEPNTMAMNEINFTCTALAENEGGLALQQQTSICRKRRRQRHEIPRTAMDPFSRIICFNTVIQSEHPLLECLWIPWSLSMDLKLEKEENQA